MTSSSRMRAAWVFEAGSRYTVTMALVASAVSFVVALLIGGLAIYVGGRVLTSTEDYSHAVITALFGAIVWALTSWIPLIGLFIALIAWIWVINWRYPGDWWTAGAIGIVAWLAALVILYALDLMFDLGVGAFGIPGV